MGRCETCGNNYEKAFTVTMNNQEHTFDSFECAIHALAPHCSSCGIPIIGHGVEDGDNMYCCAGCARMVGVKGLVDHVDHRNNP